MMIRRKQGKPLALSLCDGNAKCRLIPVSKILTCHIIHSYLLERYIHYALPLMFSFLRATEHRGGGGGGGTASYAFTLSEVAIRGFLWKKVFLKILQISKKTFFTEHLRTTASFFY